MSSLNEPAIVTRAASAASRVAETHGVRCEAPIVVSNANNVLVRVPPAPVVARVATLMSTIRPHGGSEALARELDVCAYLVGRGAAVVPPSRELPPGPHLEDGLWLSFWEHVEGDASQPPDLEQAARALAELHATLAICPLELPVLEPVAHELPRVLDTLEAAGIDGDDLAVLREALGLVIASTASLGLPRQVVHGDAHTGNLLTTAAGLIWADFEDTCIAPVARDLACLCMPVGPLRTRRWAPTAAASTRQGLSRFSTPARCTRRSGGPGLRSATAREPNARSSGCTGGASVSPSALPATAGRRPLRRPAVAAPLP
jgi:hypothetical protein